MRYLYILLTFSLFFSGCEEKKYGCKDNQACNYNQDVTDDDGTCIYPEENDDCDGNCIVDTDCFGECDGDAVVDECGECDGDGPSYQCLDNSIVCDSFDCPISVEEYFSYNVSNQAAFYFFNLVTISEVPIDSTDWVAAFRDDICVGSQQWTCQGSCEVPVYGEYSLNQDTEGYMLPGEFPSFKVYDASENMYYDAVPSNQVPWQDGMTPVIDSLIVQ